MKRKTMSPRNPFVAAAKFRKAGAHKKTNKALRRQEKMQKPEISDDRFDKNETGFVNLHYANRVQTKAITHFCLHS